MDYDDDEDDDENDKNFLDKFENFWYNVFTIKDSVWHVG
jgi:hypothetical protein